MVVWLSSGFALHLLASAVIPLVGIKAALRFRVPGLFSFRQWCKNSPNPVAHTPQKQLLLKLHWNRFLAVFSDTTFKSSAKSGLSSARSRNNGWRKKSWLLLQTRGKSAARDCVEITLHRGRRVSASGSCHVPCYSSLRLWPACGSQPSSCLGVDLYRSVPLLWPCGDCECAGPSGAIAGAAWGEEGAVLEAQHRAVGAEA